MNEWKASILNLNKNLIFSFNLIIELLSINQFMFPINSSPRCTGSAGWLHVLFPVTVFAEKSKYTEARQEKSTLHHRTVTLHNRLLWSW
jgi:hypothetical protein